jgi:hypothetical protein
MEKVLNKKGQLDIPIIGFVVVVLILLFLAPFMLKIVRTGTTGFQTAIGNQSEEAGENVAHVRETFTGFWDAVIALAFLANIILFLVSAFLIDVHPSFVLIFMLTGFFTLIFAPIVLDSLQQIWGLSEFSQETAQLPITSFILNHFGKIITAVMLIGGVVLYSKFKFFGGGRTI